MWVRRDPNEPLDWEEGWEGQCGCVRLPVSVSGWVATARHNSPPAQHTPLPTQQRPNTHTHSADNRVDRPLLRRLCRAAAAGAPHQLHPPRFHGGLHVRPCVRLLVG